MSDLKNWAGCPRPPKQILEGRYVTLAPIDATWHGDGLYDISTMAEAQDRFRWLSEYPPESREEFEAWLKWAQASTDPMYFAIIDNATGKVAGRQTFLRIEAAMGVIEIGHIYWSSLVARKPAATEAFYLFADLVFSKLGYRRFEWKCNNENEPSKRAAERFGMTHEGVFRQHLIVKGKNRDTAWYSIIDSEWPKIGSAMQQWLSPENFDANGLQIRKLEEFY